MATTDEKSLNQEPLRTAAPAAVGEGRARGPPLEPCYGPTRRKNALDGSDPCGCEKNGVKSAPSEARPS
jgi:hypothetical protein